MLDGDRLGCYEGKIFVLQIFPHLKMKSKIFKHESTPISKKMKKYH